MKRLLRTLLFLLPLLAAGILYGRSDVPIQFDSYHGYTGAVSYLKKVAKANPGLTELIEIGRSNMDRPIYVLVISNMKTGTTIDRFVNLRNMRKEGVQNVTPMKSYQGKPGQWICGSTHGNEFTGTEVCLYIIDKLMSGYGTDPEITRLVDDDCFYICPVVNPDGVFNSVENGVAQRTNSAYTDDDHDGKINEDGPDDLNGDGCITRFRYRDEKGRYVIDDEDPRLMIRLGRNEKSDKPRYSVITEDRDNDNDGKRGEDGEGGIDLNRNFPEGWFKPQFIPGGSGEFPTSAPETRAIAEFFTTHRNIFQAQFYHTSGGFTFRPMGTAPDSQMDTWDRAVFDMVMGKQYLEIIGEQVPAAWLHPDSLAAYKKLLSESKSRYAAARGYELPRGWRVSYNEIDDKRYSYGMATDWAYKQYGIYSITTELWNPSKDIPDFPVSTGKNRYLQNQRALLRYQDEHYGGSLFVPWKPYHHPELGDGEIGGWKAGYANNALPGAPLRAVCEKHWQFEKFRAGLLPKIEITKAEADVLYARQGADEPYTVVKVSLTVKNSGSLPTNVAAGPSLPCNREDVAWLVGDRDKISFIQGSPDMKLGMLEGTLNIPGIRLKPPRQDRNQYRGRYRQAPAGSERVLASRTLRDEEKPQRGSSRDVTWLVAVKGKTDLAVVVTSLKGGTAVKKISIK